jgi:hypothetical protein
MDANAVLAVKDADPPTDALATIGFSFSLTKVLRRSMEKAMSRTRVV